MATKPRILFVSSNGACRAHMAEGFVHYLAGSLVSAETAVTATGEADPYCSWAMNEAGIDISVLSADPLSRKTLSSFSHVVTLGGRELVDRTALPSGVRLDEWLVADPAEVRGRPLDRILAYRMIRLDIERRVKQLLTEILGREPS